ncbi:MAG: MBL fold metallo-hydrolase [Bacteroidales bacterium]|nr:MBL fold metallo-hydrolase [Bacteroidales bacterium]
MIQIKTFYFNDLRTCCYLLWDQSLEAIIVDPGCHSAGEKERLRKYVAQEGLHLKYVVNTHAHFDHIMGNAFVCAQWGIKACIHPADRRMLEQADQYVRAFNMEIEKPPVDTLPLCEQQPLCFGDSNIRVLETPGHSPGGICLYAPQDGFLISGDTLFAGSIGRTDLPGGDFDQLMHSITTKLLPLDSSLRVLPGHGPETTIGHERLHNPFLAPNPGRF